MHHVGKLRNTMGQKIGLLWCCNKILIGNNHHNTNSLKWDERPNLHDVVSRIHEYGSSVIKSW